MQGSVARHQNAESGVLGGVQELAVLQAAPAHVRHSEGFMMAEERPEIVGDVFIQQDLHETG